MKRFFYIVGCLTVLMISFIYSNKVTMVVREHDEIMIRIKEEYEKTKVKMIDGVVDGDYIIPGINGSEIDVEKSYSRMRQLGVYSDKYLIYKDIKVTNSLDKCKDKYIKVGNSNKGSVSLVFIVENKNMITDRLLSFLKNENVEVTILLDGYWVEENKNLVMKMISDNHELGSIGYNYDYNGDDYVWLDNVLKSFKKKISFCIKSDKGIENCIKRNNRIIDPIIIDKDYYLSSKLNIKSGSIIAYKLSNQLMEELPSIIDYGISKGIDFVKLSNLIKE